VPGDSNEASDVFVHDLWIAETARVSTNSAGEQGDNGSYESSISEDGRYVAFASYATNLVPLDSNGTIDVFLHDREASETWRVSISSDGAQGDSWSIEPSVSADGRYVVFASRSTNLVPGDSNDYCDDGDTIIDDNCPDIFVHDRATGDTTRVSLDSHDREGNGRSLFPAISGDGRYVAFLSEPTNFMRGTRDVAWGTFVRDRRMGKTIQVAQEPWRIGMETFGVVFIMGRCRPALSTDGRYVTFAFAIDGQIAYSNTSGGRLEKASVNQAGEQVLGTSESPSISGDGRHIAFSSWAMNLAPGDDGKYAQVYVRKLPVPSENVSAMGITAAAIAGAAASTTLAAAATSYVRRRRQERLM
jgi:Tol biopolymer transport system component